MALKTMKKRICGFCLTIAVIGVASHGVAQEKAAPSRTRVGAGIDGAAIILDYARPGIAAESGTTNKSLAGVVPYNKVWPIGGSSPGLLISDRDLVIGKAIVPAGTNSLYAMVGEDGSAKLVISKQIAGGEAGYDPAQDVARVDMEKQTLPRTVDPLTLAVVMEPAGGGTLKMMIDRTQFSARFFVRK